MCQECGCDARTALTCPDCGGRVILINGETKCLSCGASPSLEAASPEQEEHHRSQHHADHKHIEPDGEVDAGAREELLTKLCVLIPHWIEHNEEHADTFRTWAERARAAGDAHLAAHIEVAAQKIADANRDLEGLIEHIDETASDHAHLHHDHPH